MRLLLGMTQEEYGQKVVGLSRKVVSAIEKDAYNPTLETLKKNHQTVRLIDWVYSTLTQ